MTGLRAGWSGSEVNKLTVRRERFAARRRVNRRRPAPGLGFPRAFGRQTKTTRTQASVAEIESTLQAVAQEAKKRPDRRRKQGEQRKEEAKLYWRAVCALKPPPPPPPCRADVSRTSPQGRPLGKCELASCLNTARPGASLKKSCHDIVNENVCLLEGRSQAYAARRSTRRLTPPRRIFRRSLPSGSSRVVASGGAYITVSTMSWRGKTTGRQPAVRK